MNEFNEKRIQEDPDTQDITNGETLRRIVALISQHTEEEYPTPEMDERLERQVNSQLILEMEADSGQADGMIVKAACHALYELIGEDFTNLLEAKFRKRQVSCLATSTVLTDFSFDTKRSLLNTLPHARKVPDKEDNQKRRISFTFENPLIAARILSPASPSPFPIRKPRPAREMVGERGFAGSIISAS
jgi:hypothetical protein